MICFKNGPASWMKALESKKVGSLQFHSEQPVAVHADGEQLGTEISHLSVEVVPEILPVITGY